MGLEEAVLLSNVVQFCRYGWGAETKNVIDFETSLSSLHYHDLHSD